MNGGTAVVRASELNAGLEDSWTSLKIKPWGSIDDSQIRGQLNTVAYLEETGISRAPTFA